MKESLLRSQFRKWCKRKGYMQIAMTGVTMAGVPDTYLVDKCVWIEFKNPETGKTSKIQDYVIKEIRNHGGTVLIIDDINQLEFI